MLASMMKNAGLISLAYPFVVFGYALMEERSPCKRLWYAYDLHRGAHPREIHLSAKLLGRALHIGLDSNLLRPNGEAFIVHSSLL
jgi:hypothetical protein